MAARKPRKDNITVVSMMILEDGSIVPFEDLTEEQKQRWREACCKRLSDRLNAHFSQHPEEYIKLIEGLERAEGERS